MSTGWLYREIETGKTKIGSPIGGPNGTNDQGIVGGGSVSFASIDRQSGGGLGIQTVALIAMIDGKATSISNGDVNLSTADATNPRIDIIQWDGATVTAKAGTAGATPICPFPDDGNVILAAILVPANATALVSMNGQTATTQAVIIAYYYVHGGLHASRVGVTNSPSSTSTSFIDADEMFLSVHFPRSGFRYEWAWDTQISQALYGALNEGVLIGANHDGTDENDNIITRGYLHNNLTGGVSIHGFEIGQSLHYNRFIVGPGSHRFKGRWKVGTASTAQVLRLRRRRIWIREMI